MLSQDRIETLNNVLEDLTNNFTKTKQAMLGIVDMMFITLTHNNPQWSEQDQNKVFKEVFRPMQERVLKAVAEREGNKWNLIH